MQASPQQPCLLHGHASHVCHWLNVQVLLSKNSELQYKLQTVSTWRQSDAPRLLIAACKHASVPMNHSAPYLLLLGRMAQGPKSG